VHRTPNAERRTPHRPKLLIMQRGGTTAMPTTFYFVNITIHVLVAIFWLGGMFFFALVGAPALRAVEPAALRQRLFHQIGLRARKAGWWAIAVLLVTGTLNLYLRGMLQWDGLLGTAAFWAGPFGHSLAIKLGAVLCMLIVSITHDFIVGPAAGRAAAGSAEAVALRRRAALLARINAILGLIIVIAAVQLARGV
ncbi:MAG: CopD family protein, partial [Gemmatimonadota bacterium]